MLFLFHVDDDVDDDVHDDDFDVNDVDDDVHDDDFDANDVDDDASLLMLANEITMGSPKSWPVKS